MCFAYGTKKKLRNVVIGLFFCLEASNTVGIYLHSSDIVERVSCL